MRIRIASASVLVLAMAFVPGARAGDDKTSSDKADKTQGKQTIRGIVSGVTVEGETIIDNQTHKAVTAEAAYLTVVGHPEWAGSDGKDNDKDRKDASSTDSPRRRHNVYLVWLSPKTKVCECCDESGKSSEAKECSWDKLEIGDRVEVVMTTRDKSGSNSNDKAAMKHGRHRTFMGDANEIRILPNEDQGSKDRDKDKDKNKDGDKAKK